MRRCTFVLLALLFVAGCKGAPAETAAAAATQAAQSSSTQPGAAAPATTVAMAGQTEAPPPTAKPVPAVLPDVVARVNGEAIQKGEFERALKNVEARAGRPVPPEQRDQVYRGVLDQLVAYHLLLQESKTRKIQISDSDVDARIAELGKQFPDAEGLEKALAARGTTMVQLRQDMLQDLTLTRLIDAEVKAQVKVQEGDIKDFYDKNPDRFQEPEAVRASHILIKTDPNATDAQKAEARAKAEEILKQVKSGGDFAALARQHSQDGSAPEGGDLKFFSQGQMVPQFEQAAFAMKPGETSGVVETQFGFHIIKTTERRPSRTVPLAEVAPKIGEYLASQQQAEKAETFVNGLKAKSKIEILI